MAESNDIFEEEDEDGDDDDSVGGRRVDAELSANDVAQLQMLEEELAAAHRGWLLGEADDAVPCGGGCPSLASHIDLPSPSLNLFRPVADCSRGDGSCCYYSCRVVISWISSFCCQRRWCYCATTGVRHCVVIIRRGRSSRAILESIELGMIVGWQRWA